MQDILSRIIPKPQQLISAKGVFPWENGMVLICEPDNAEDAFAAQTLLEGCCERNLPGPRISATQDFAEAAQTARILIGDPSRNWPLLKAMQNAGIDVPPQVNDQGYALHITPERILIIGYTPAAIYYGVQTLIQLLPRQGEQGVPCCTINDWTVVGQRGISLDLFSGEVYTLDMFKECIRRLAHYKMNVFVPYFEDAFEFPSHPDIGQGRDRLLFSEAQELVAFAHKHHVEIIPCYDSPGHIGHTLRHPNYQYLRESDETRKLDELINVTHPDTYPLMRDLYGDLCKAFPSPVVYVSADEALAIGSGKSKEILKEVGAANLFLRHVKILRDFLASHGRRMALAGDPFEPEFFKAFGLTNYGIEALQKVPHDVIIGPWHYGKMPEFPFGPQLKEMGYDQYLWTSNQAFRRLYPAQRNGAENVEDFAPYGHDLKALGIVHSDWNLPGEYTFHEYNWISNLHYAEWAWNKEGRPWDELLPLIAIAFYGPGTEALADTVNFLSNFAHYFRWADPEWGEPEYKLFFKPVEPEELDEKNLGLLKDFRHDLVQAREAFEKAKKEAIFHVDHLDYYDFCLTECVILADLVEARHLMAKTDDESRRQLKMVLEKLHEAFPPMFSRYEELWLRVSKPLGLEDSRRLFNTVKESIDKALAE